MSFWTIVGNVSAAVTITTGAWQLVQFFKKRSRGDNSAPSALKLSLGFLVLTLFIVFGFYFWIQTAKSQSPVRAETPAPTPAPTPKPAPVTQIEPPPLSPAPTAPFEFQISSQVNLQWDDGLRITVMRVRIMDGYTIVTFKADAQFANHVVKLQRLG